MISLKFRTLVYVGVLVYAPVALSNPQPTAEQNPKQITGHEKYSSPLDSRYSSDEMLRLWSDDTKFKTWRRMWAPTWR